MCEMLLVEWVSSIFRLPATRGQVPRHTFDVCLCVCFGMLLMLLENSPSINVDQCAEMSSFELHRNIYTKSLASWQRVELAVIQVICTKKRASKISIRINFSYFRALDEFRLATWDDRYASSFEGCFRDAHVCGLACEINRPHQRDCLVLATPSYILTHTHV